MSTADTAVLMQNRLLATIHADELTRMQSAFVTRDFRIGQVVTQRGQPITELIFPVDAVFSVVAESEGGETDAGVVGNDGVVGFNVFLGQGESNLRTRCQVPGMALVAGLAELGARADGALTSGARRYAAAFMTMAAQGSGCMAKHRTEERAARWLLMIHDRSPSETFVLTHEYLAITVGATRPAVTNVAIKLRDAGLIGYDRGQITILDRARLQAIACACYDIITEEYERSVGTRLRKGSATANAEAA